MSPSSHWPIVVLASGRGSNLQALHEASQFHGLPIRIAGVISDKADCGAIVYAREQGIPCQTFSSKDYTSREAFDLALMQAVSAYQPKLIVCAGYMRIISEAGLNAAPCPMINIHPSLLPHYTGLHTHARVIADGRHEHGASIHLVNTVLDGGRVLSQAKVAVLAEDSAQSLAERVLNREHPLLIETVRALIEGRLFLQQNASARVVWLQDDNSTLE